jgi:hypothetical protein
MRPSYFLLCALFSPAVIGCSDSLPGTPVIPEPDPTLVHIKSGIMPKFMAYRDGFVDPTSLQPVAWKTATPSTTGTTDIMVKGAYTVAVVCDLDATTVLTWQGFHNIDDDIPAKGQPPTLETGCQPRPALHTVSGKMIHAGQAQLGPNGISGPVAAGDTASFAVPDGKYDLVAAQTDAATPAMNKVLIVRNIVVAGADVTLPDIDTATGFALVAITPELDNPPPDVDPDDPTANTETATAEVAIQTKNNGTSAFVSAAEFNRDTKTANKDKKVTVYAIPDANLAADDIQNVIFIGANHVLPDDKININTTRSILKPLGKVTGDAAIGKAGSGFALPTGITIPAWGMDNKRLSVALPALPALDDLTVEAIGTVPNASGRKPVYVIDITASYFGDTTIARPIFDTDIPNFPADAKIDFSKAYERMIRSQRDVLNMSKVLVAHEESEFDELVDPTKQ